MAREVAITFALNAALKGGYKAAFQGAASQARNVASALRQMERTPVGKLGSAMATQREKIKGLGTELRAAQTTLGRLQAQAQASGGATGMLARQIQQAESRVKNLNGALGRQLGAWRNTTAQAATASGSIRRLSEEYGRLSSRMERARKASQALHANSAQGDALRAQRSSLHSQLLSAAGTAMTVALPAKIAVDFEDSIARVGAVANASEADMARLTATARQLGRDTVFSASQAAEGMKYLAMAGFDANETISAMPGMLDLAAAGNTDLGRTADIASDILSAFKLKAEDMGQVSDTLAKTFTTSNTSLEMLGDTMKYVGPVAASVGMSLQDTSAMAGMLGNVGIKASQAGTVMRAALLRLAAPARMARDALGELAGVEGEELDKLVGEMDGAEDALKELGMTTKDQAGNLRPMVDILEELNARTAKMGTGQKAEVFKKIFGSEASAGMIALAEQAAVTVDKYGKKITNSLGQPTNALRAYMEKVGDYEGTGARIAKRMNETTGGALRRLKSAWEDVGISVGNLFLPAISGVADGLSTVGNVISGVTQRFPRLSRGVALIVGGFLAFIVAEMAFGLALNAVKTGLNAARGAMLFFSLAQVGTAATTESLTVAQKMSQLATISWREALAGGRAALVGLAGRIAAFVGIQQGATVATVVFTAVQNVMATACGIASGALRILGTAVRFALGPLGIIITALTVAVGLIIDNWSTVGPFFSSLWDGITGIFKGAWEIIKGIVDKVVGAVSAIGEAIDKIPVLGSAKRGLGKAWDAVFGDDEDKKEKNAAPVAANAQENSAAQLAGMTQDNPALAAAFAQDEAAAQGATKDLPTFTPVSASAVAAASGASGSTGKGKGKSRRAGSGAGSGGGASSRTSSGSGGGPVTVVTVGGDNSAPQTLFFPAGGAPASMPAAAAAAQAAEVARALPQAPELANAAMRGAGKSGSSTSGSVTVDLTQNFDLIADDARAVRKVLESIKPDMEALVRRALEKLQSDRRRTAYAQ